MGRLGKYMVFNPLQDKPKKYYSNLTQAVSACHEVCKRENQDCLVLQVVAKYEPRVIGELKTYDPTNEENI